MPRYVRPNAPAALEKAIDVFGGNHAKIAILGFLAQAGPATSAEVAEGTGLGRPTAKAHLYQLTSDGVVVADPAFDVPVEDRTGKRVKYSVVPQEIAKHYQALGKALNIQDPGPANPSA
ncbi:ArsR/SmtB family transcription factor (plasmid) [Arthrobacter sp. G.S.26]|uniref:ArsR/SmtB family transcription factor n=1 Tax=Arthrobacter sp. G.S.26 TaxID=3433706 RepID=UPI003D782A22